MVRRCCLENHEPTPADLHQFDRWLQHHARTSEHKPLAYNTRRDVLRRLRQCLHWAFADRRFLPVDVSVWVPVPPPQKNRAGRDPGRTAPPDRRHRRLVQPLRDGCAIALLMQTGIRRIELCTIQVETIQMAADWSGVLRVSGKHTSANPDGRAPRGVRTPCGQVCRRLSGCPGLARRPAAAEQSGDRWTCAPLTASWMPRSSGPAWLGSLPGAMICAGPLTTFRRRNRGEEFDHLLRRQIGHSSAATTDIYDLIDVADLVDVIRGRCARILRRSPLEAGT